MDTYAAHRTPQVREFAALLKITLRLIRRDGSTNISPDPKIVGVLKSDARQAWRRHYHQYAGA
jgi:hypothetical protein